LDNVVAGVLDLELRVHGCMRVSERGECMGARTHGSVGGHLFCMLGISRYSVWPWT
jgi:hypothetical protein